ncbi:CobB-S (fragment) [Desulfarculales bacterium]
MAALCGAGISAEPGVPTLRGADGLWENHRPEDLATPQVFARDPTLVGRWYHWWRQLISRCQPNPAHRTLADLERRLGDTCTLIIQNVDGLHSLTGSREQQEFHGSLRRVSRLGCGCEHEQRRLDLSAPPRCPDCGGLCSGVVWFGENLMPACWTAPGGRPRPAGDAGI